MVSLEGGPGYVNPYHQAWQCQADQPGETQRKTERLTELLLEEEEPVIGLEKVVEWWPDHGREETPVYSCQLCDGFLGWAGAAVSHLRGDNHRRAQLVARYPALEEMIKDMESGELMERAREEERKLGRRCEAIQVVVDIETYQEFYQKLELKPFQPRESGSQGYVPAQYQDRAPPLRVPPPRVPPPLAPPPLVPPVFTRPPPALPLPCLPPVNVPPPMNFPPPPPPFQSGIRENSGPGGQRGRLTFPGGSARGTFSGRRGGHSQPQPINPRGNQSGRGNFSSHRDAYSAPRDLQHSRDYNVNARSNDFSQQDESYGFHSRYSSTEVPEHFVREELLENRDGYQDNYEGKDQRNRGSSGRRQGDTFYDEPFSLRGRQYERPRARERNLREPTEGNRSQQKSSQRTIQSSQSRRRPRRRREVLSDDEELPEACYAVSADQEELDTENNSGGIKRKRNDNGRNRSYDDYYGQFHEKSRRSITKFYESKLEKRNKSRLAIVEDKPYEGPTIFDKVFRTKRKCEDDGVPGGEKTEKQIDREMEKEWRRYKEESEERIRREKQRLEKYEKKLQELHGNNQNKKTRKSHQTPSSPERKSDPRAKSPPKAYGGRASYSSSESDREISPDLSYKSKSEGEADRCQTKFDPY